MCISGNLVHDSLSTHKEKDEEDVSDLGISPTEHIREGRFFFSIFNLIGKNTGTVLPGKID